LDNYILAVANNQMWSFMDQICQEVVDAKERQRNARRIPGEESLCQKWNNTLCLGKPDVPEENSPRKGLGTEKIGKAKGSCEDPVVEMWKEIIREWVDSQGPGSLPAEVASAVHVRIMCLNTFPQVIMAMRAMGTYDGQACITEDDETEWRRIKIYPWRKDKVDVTTPVVGSFATRMFRLCWWYVHQGMKKGDTAALEVNWPGLNPTTAQASDEGLRPSKVGEQRMGKPKQGARADGRDAQQEPAVADSTIEGASETAAAVGKRIKREWKKWEGEKECFTQPHNPNHDKGDMVYAKAGRDDGCQGRRQTSLPLSSQEIRNMKVKMKTALLLSKLQNEVKEDQTSPVLGQVGQATIALRRARRPPDHKGGNPGRPQN
jgi:hypothetical protein